MYKELLKEIVSSIAGDKAKAIVDLLYDKKNVNEFLISKKMSMMINQTRHILYRLADDGLVSFVRKKDNKKGGWYTYFWTLHINKGLAKYQEHLLESIENLNNQIHIRKNERYYFCTNCGVEMSEEHALGLNYTCSECGEVLQLRDNLKEAQNIEKEKAKKEKILAEIDNALADLKGQEEKSRQRRIKSEEKKKKKDKDKKKKERQRLKKKERKKLEKNSKKKKR